MTTAVVPFLIVYGISYFFTEFGPNMTTFVLPSELYPVVHARHRARDLGGHRQARRVHRGLPVPGAEDLLGLRGTLLLTGGVSVAGLLLTLVLPEPAGRSLDEISGPPPTPVPRWCGWPVRHS